MLLNPQGSRLFYRDRDDGLVTCSVPNSPRHGLGKPRRFEVPSGGTFVGAGRHGRNVVCLATTDGQVFLRSTQPLRRGAASEHSIGWRGAPGGSLWPLLLFPGELEVAFVDGERSLWILDLMNGRSRIVASGVRAVSPLAEGGGLVAVERYVTPELEERGAVLLVTRSDVKPLYVHTTVWRQAFLRVLSTSPFCWAVAGEEPQGNFRIVSHTAERQPHPVRFPDTSTKPTVLSLTLSGCPVVGCDWTGIGAFNLGVYMLNHDGTELFVIGRGRSRSLVNAASGISRVALATNRGLAAYTTRDGELGFVERSGKTRWRGRMDGSV
jgi:hypothetical protein